MYVECRQYYHFFEMKNHSTTKRWMKSYIHSCIQWNSYHNKQIDKTKIGKQKMIKIIQLQFCKSNQKKKIYFFEAVNRKFVSDCYNSY